MSSVEAYEYNPHDVQIYHICNLAVNLRLHVTNFVILPIETEKNHVTNRILAEVDSNLLLIQPLR